MKVSVENANIIKIKADLLAIFIYEDKKTLSGDSLKLDIALSKVISKLIKSKEISGKSDTSCIIHTFGKIPADRIVVVGLGKSKDYNADVLRKAAAQVIGAAKKVKAESVAAVILGNLDAEAFVDGAINAGYSFDVYKEKDKDSVKIEKLVVLEPNQSNIKQLKSRISLIADIADSANMAKDLVNSPSNVITPTYIANYAKEMAQDVGIKCEIYDFPKIEKMGLGAFYAVAKGSREPAKLVILKYKGSGKDIIGLIGKGITFDSGGISIKPSKNMSEMKSDMAGAAAVIETMRVIAGRKCKHNVIAVIPLTENMPSGGAYKPGDILKSLSGKTIEIISTDAEGRLILADALSYAIKLGATKLIDIATLTGGCVVALGDICSAVLGSDEKMIKDIVESGNASGEKMWQLPIFSEYDEYLKSDFADTKNCTEHGKASPIVGAIFLKKFIGDIPWVHIDIAGTAYIKTDATGVGVRTFSKYLLS